MDSLPSVFGLEGLVNIGLTLARAVAIVFWWQRVFGPWRFAHAY